MEGDDEAVVVFDGLAAAESGYDFDIIVPSESEFFGICKMLESASVETLDPEIAHAFEHEHSFASAKDRAEQYRRNNDRSCPPVYRLKITVECMEVDAVTAEQYWQDRRK